MLAIRNNYINIYYRGGNICEISQNKEGGSYIARIDENYNKQSDKLPLAFPFNLNALEQTFALVQAMPELKYRMDRFFAKNGKSEREFQQLVVRENNHSPISGKTHYFIVDIEIAGFLPNARHDMLAVRWLSHERNRPGVLVPALIEMKYGTDALDGASGLIKHMSDAFALRKQAADWGLLLSGLETQLTQLDDLGLLTFNRSARVERLEIDRNATPELIFLIAGHNPGSTKLPAILNTIDLAQTTKDCGFDLLFFAASFAGYGLYREAMLTLEQFKVEVATLFRLASITRRNTTELNQS